MMGRVATLGLGLTLLLVLQQPPGTEAEGRPWRKLAPLRPCRDVPGGKAGVDCFGSVLGDTLPPCDLDRHEAAVVCSGVPHSAPASEGSKTQDALSQPRTSFDEDVVVLPPCSEMPHGGTPGWDCWPPLAPTPA